jgi:Tol biopolymer transport system component
VVLAGSGAGGQRLYRRRVDQLEATPITGTEGGSSPFFSPDGAWIGFFADGKIQRIPLEGGAPVDIVALKGERFLAGACWAPDDRIIFAAGPGGPLNVVSVAGGDPTQLTTLAAGEDAHLHPEVLPDGRTVLFTSGGRIHALDAASRRRAALVTGEAPRYANGRVIFTRGSVLLSAPFDPSRLKLTGSAEPLVDGVASDGGYASHYAVSRAGDLAYLPGATTQDLVLVDAAGAERLLVKEPMAFQNPQFSPSGSHLAVATGRTTSDRTEIWIHDLRSGEAAPLTFDGGRAPVWMPDGARITYSKLPDPRGIYTKRVDGRGDAELLLRMNEFHWLVGWTPDGQTLVYGRIDDTGQSSLLALTKGQPRVIVGPGSIWGGRLSPDGRWLAYYVMEAGRFRVYVTPFPAARARWLVSEDGGRDPSWGPRDNELYYRSGDRLMSVRLDTTSGVRVTGRRQVLGSFAPPLYDDYQIHPDGHTLVHVRPHAESDREVVLVLNAFAEVDGKDRR